MTGDAPTVEANVNCTEDPLTVTDDTATGAELAVTVNALAGAVVAFNASL